MTNEQLKELRDLASKSTRVVAWYPHGRGNQCGLNEATVRGPCFRWFRVVGGEDYATRVADVEDDAKFAAAAMNNLVPLLDEIDALRALLKDKEHL